MRGLQLGPVIYKNSSSNVTVYKGSISYGDTAVAIKEQGHDSVEAANTVLKEALVMMSLSHRNIVKLMDTKLEEKKHRISTVLVLELMDKTLAEEVNERRSAQRTYSEEELLVHLADLTNALCFAKKVQISHRALSLSTVFVSGQVLKLGGFACSDQHYDGLLSSSTLPSHSLFLSPELRGMHGSPYNSFQADVFSLGMVILSMARLMEPEEMENGFEEGKIAQILAGLPQYPKLVRYLEGMLKTDPDERVAVEILLDNLQLSVQAQPFEVPVSTCQTCRNPVLNLQWTQQVRCTVNPVFCSVKCYTRSLPLQYQNCSICSIRISEEAVFLACGHSLHNKDCLFNFLRSESYYFSKVVHYKCPTCSEEIQQSLISAIFGEEEYRRREEKAFESLCDVCRLTEWDTRLKCGHSCCRKCVRPLFFLDKCQICGRIS